VYSFTIGNTATKCAIDLSDSAEEKSHLANQTSGLQSGMHLHCDTSGPKDAYLEELHKRKALETKSSTHFSEIMLEGTPKKLNNSVPVLYQSS
jgi:hypothetical protein